MQMPFAVIFDVDGVICETETLNARASVIAFYQLYGVTVHHEDFAPFIGTGDENYMLGVARKHGVDIDVERATRQREKNLLDIVDREGLSPCPGVLDLITEAYTDPGTHLAIATSGRLSKAFPLLDAVGVQRRWFDVVVTGDLVSRKKPHPEIYQITISHLGVPPSACVVIEDSPAGVRAAKAAGASCLAVTNSVPADDLSPADIILPSLADLSLHDLHRLIRL